MKYLRHHITARILSAVLTGAFFAPWAMVFVLPEQAFAQMTSARTTTSGVPGSAAQAAFQNPRGANGELQLTWSQAAASGVAGIGTCLAAGGISVGAGLASAAKALGLSTGSSALGSLGSAGVGAGLSGAAGVGSGAGSFAGASGGATGQVPGGGAGGGLMVPVIDPTLIATNKAGFATLASILGAQTILIGKLDAKENMFDCIAWALAKLIWRSVAAALIDWINSGFNGRPAFVQDFERFFLGVVDQAIGSVIEGVGLAFLCSPFSLNIRIALASSFAQRAPTCTLTQVIANIENFANSFQTGGGWPAWLQMNVMSANNPYGGYLTANATVVFTYQTKLGLKQYELGINSGFLSTKKKVCQKDAAGNDTTNCRELTQTPGLLMAEQLGQTIGGGQTTLLMADEFDEIVSALVSQLLMKAMGSIFGLSQPTGYQDDYYRGTTFTGDLSTDTTVGDADGTQQSLMIQLNDAIVAEQNIQVFYQRGIQIIENVQQGIDQVVSCWVDKVTSTSTTYLADPGDRSQAIIQGNTVRFGRDALERRKAEFQNGIAQSERNLVLIDALIARVSSAATTDELAGVVIDWNTAKASGDLAEPRDVASLQEALDRLQADMDLTAGSTQTDLITCQYFPFSPLSPPVQIQTP